MPIEIRGQQTSFCIRRPAFDQSGLTRVELDARFSLTDDEFRVERDLIVVGPLTGDVSTDVLAALEAAGLSYYDDFFELSGNWPDWLTVYAMHSRPAQPPG